MNHEEYAKQLPHASDDDLLRNARLCHERDHVETLKLVLVELTLRGLWFNVATGRLERLRKE